MYQLSQDLPQLQQRINTFLAQQLNVDSSPSPLAEAMRYGVLLGGKRIRPFLVYATGRMLGRLKPTRLCRGKCRSRSCLFINSRRSPCDG
ncbi:hypothetical protein AAUPMB_05468 [Pasteurella multocida subsp. multocida str. Anand1_buffalo]|nr:hypothetical protein AAUPMB_05468 [Pasteurella multocida subsp. multocida str. Anand1_buffalo]